VHFPSCSSTPPLWWMITHDPSSAAKAIAAAISEGASSAIHLSLTSGARASQVVADAVAGGAVIAQCVVLRGVTSSTDFITHVVTTTKARAAASREVVVSTTVLQVTRAFAGIAHAAATTTSAASASMASLLEGASQLASILKTSAAEFSDAVATKVHHTVLKVASTFISLAHSAATATIISSTVVLKSSPWAVTILGLKVVAIFAVVLLWLADAHTLTLSIIRRLPSRLMRCYGHPLVRPPLSTVPSATGSLVDDLVPLAPSSTMSNTTSVTGSPSPSTAITRVSSVAVDDLGACAGSDMGTDNCCPAGGEAEAEVGWSPVSCTVVVAGGLSTQRSIATKGKGDAGQALTPRDEPCPYRLTWPDA